MDNNPLCFNFIIGTPEAHVKAALREVFDYQEPYTKVFALEPNVHPFGVGVTLTQPTGSLNAGACMVECKRAYVDGSKAYTHEDAVWPTTGSFMGGFYPLVESKIFVEDKPIRTVSHIDNNVLSVVRIRISLPPPIIQIQLDWGRQSTFTNRRRFKRRIEWITVADYADH